MSCFRFGPQGHMVEIPAPSTGMGFDLNHDVTISELVSGERSVYRTPLGFKSFDMNWAGGTNGLGEFMDIFEGDYGNGPYYMYDPRSAGQNQLPSRWASCWKLGHLANGWGQPKVSTQTGGTATPEGMEVLFTGRTNLPVGQATSPFSVLVPIEYGETFNMTAWGTATGGAQLVATPFVGEAPLAPIIVPLNGTASSDIVANYLDSQMFVKLHLYVPAGATLMLRHMELMQQQEVLRTNLCTNPGAETNTTGWTGQTSTLTSDTAWAQSGTRSFKVVPSGFASDMRAGSPVIIPFGMQAGGTYTVSATMRLAAPQINGTDVRARRVSLLYSTNGVSYTTVNGTQGANVAGTFRSRCTVNLPADATGALVMLGAGSSNPADIIWWDDVLIEESPEQLPYFDGNSPMTSTTSYRWTGTANNSASQEYVGDGKQWHMGRGVGAVQFNGNMQGTLTSNKVDRIGLSVGVTEVAS